MANYIATCRSNYFLVKNREAFEEFCDLWELEVLRQNEEDGVIRFGFAVKSEYGSIPTTRYDEDLNEDVGDFIPELASHLQTNEVAVIMETGAEKWRYVYGCALAVAHTGETVFLELDNIYALAQEEFGGDANITRAAY